MSINSVHKVQIVFWDILIRALTESKLIRMVIPMIYRMVTDKNFKNFCIALAIVCTGGFVSGVLLRFVIYYMR